MILFATPSHKCSDEQLGELARWAVRMAQALQLTEAKLSVVSNCPWLDCARADLVAEFLKSSCTHLFFRDDDIDLAPDVVAGLLKMQRPIAVAPYRMRSKPHAWALTMEDDRIVSAGLGAALIERGVIEMMVRRNPDLEYFQDGDKRCALFHHMLVGAGEGRTMLKEDHAFFARARACGFEVDALRGAVVNHGGIVSTWEGVL